MKNARALGGEGRRAPGKRKKDIDGDLGCEEAREGIQGARETGIVVAEVGGTPLALYFVP